MLPLLVPLYDAAADSFPTKQWGKGVWYISKVKHTIQKTCMNV